MKKIIHAISFLYKGERVIVRVTDKGRFKVPVSEVVDGTLSTKVKSLTARQVIEHDVIKNCDPTLYLDNNERLRVYPGGDSSYLPAQSEGIATKHDDANKVELPKFKKLKPSLNLNKSREYDKYQQVGMDLYGWWPQDDNGYAD